MDGSGDVCHGDSALPDRSLPEIWLPLRRAGGFARGHATYRDRPRLRCKNEAGFEKIDAGVMPLESGPESFEASVLTGREEPNTSPALGEGGLAHLRKRDKERMWR